MNKLNRLFLALVLMSSLSTVQGDGGCRGETPRTPSFLPFYTFSASALTFGGASLYASICVIESSMLPNTPECDEEKKELVRKFRKSLKIGGGAAVVAVASWVAWMRAIIMH